MEFLLQKTAIDDQRFRVVFIDIFGHLFQLPIQQGKLIQQKILAGFALIDDMKRGKCPG
jgi:hypothetical protein